jgi:hypothetical protein
LFLKKKLRALGALRGECVLLLFACARAAPVGPPPDAVELLERARAAHRVPETMACDAKAFVDAPQNGGRFALHIAVKRPASIHLEALSPLGDPAAVLVADKGRFALLDLRNNVFYRGPATPENLSRLLPAPLRDEELVALLTGAIPDLPGSTPQSSRRQGDGYLLVLSSGGQLQEIDLGGDLRVVEVRRKTAEGALIWAVHLDEHDDRSGAQVPRLLHLTAPAARTEVDLRLRNVQTGLPAPPSMFFLGPPPGMRVEDVR